MHIIGSQGAFLSQLCWQLRNEWSKERSLEAWHRYHPDISDDIFEQLYALAEKSCRMHTALKSPDWKGTLGDLWKAVN